MYIAYMLSGNHAWLKLLESKIERLCTLWENQLPEEEAERKIEDLMAYTRCLRQKYVHRCNYQKFDRYLNAQLTTRLA